MGELEQPHTSQPVETPSGEPRRGFWTSFGRSRQAPARTPADEPPGESGKPVPTTHVGRMLQEAREAKFISLDEAENVTRIRSKYLAALESGAYQELPTAGHVHGFLRNYAIFLGLDWQEVEALYRKENPNRHFDPGIFQPQNINLLPRRPLLRAELVLILAVLVVVVVVGGWAFWQYGRPLLYPITGSTATPATATVEQETAATQTTEPTSTRQASSTAPTATPRANTATPAVAASTPTRAQPTTTATLNSPLPMVTPTLPPTETPPPIVTRTSGVSVTIKVIERAWVQVSIDGQEQPGKIFEADEEQTWEARESIYFICGNAGGVEVTVNGEALGLLGGRAQVVEKTWTPQGEVVPTPPAEETPTPTPASE